MSNNERRSWDPFAPHKPAQPDPEPADTDEADDTAGGDAGERIGAEVWHMKKAELVVLAEKHGLSTNGTRDDLIERLRAWDDARDL